MCPQVVSVQCPDGHGSHPSPPTPPPIHETPSHPHRKPVFQVWGVPIPRTRQPFLLGTAATASSALCPRLGWPAPPLLATRLLWAGLGQARYKAARAQRAAARLPKPRPRHSCPEHRSPANQRTAGPMAGECLSFKHASPSQPSLQAPGRARPLFSLTQNGKSEGIRVSG